MRRHPKTRARRLLRPALALVPLVAAAGLASAQDEEWEWEPDEGYHEEEWYDPSDWFNDDGQIDYEYDWDDYGYWDDDFYDYGYEGGAAGPWYDYDYDDEYYEYGDADEFGYEYDNDAYSDFGTTLYDDYGTTPGSVYERAPDYGWHYEWNPVTNRWETEYGWHDGLYDADAGEMDYGWYYVWNSEQDDWEREYGWHESQYQYDTQQSAAGRMQLDEERRQQQQQQQGRMAQGDRQQRERQMQDRMSRQQQGQMGRMSQQQGQQDRMAQQQGQRGQQGQQSQQGRMAQGMGGQEQQGQTTVSGTVAGFNRMPVQGEVHTLVRLRTQEGASRVVDLGTDADLSRIDLVHGDRLTARGDVRQLFGQQVLKASSIRSGDQRARMAGQRGQQQQQQGRPGTMRFSGQLDGFQKIRMQGEREDNLFVRLRLQDGTTRVVDLGRSTELSDLDLQSGDRIMVEGTRKSMNGQPYLCAEKMRVDGEPVGIQKSSQKGGGRIGQLQGRLDGFKRVKLDAGGGDHLFVRLRMQDGTTRVVDLGPSMSLEQLDLQQGDRVRVQGAKKSLDGQPVLVANRMRVEGESVLNGRPAGQRDF